MSRFDRGPLLTCFLGSAAYYYLMREQTKADPPMLESTGAFHFLAFFVSGATLSQPLCTSHADAACSWIVRQSSIPCRQHKVDVPTANQATFGAYPNGSQAGNLGRSHCCVNRYTSGRSGGQESSTVYTAQSGSLRSGLRLRDNDCARIPRLSSCPVHPAVVSY